MERVSAPETFDLRWRVLRPHQRLEDVVLRGDEDPNTAFYVARNTTSGNVVATASVQREAPPWEPQARRDRDHAGPDSRLEVPPGVRFAAGNDGSNAWRLRAMATLPPRRRCDRRPRRLLWCGARIRAVPFYERAGFSTLGDFYEEPVVGTHVLMWRVVAASTT